MLSAAAAFLHAHGISATPEEVDAAVAEALRTQRAILYPGAGSGLTADELAFLKEGGIDPAAPLSGPDPFLRGLASHAAILKTSLTVAEVADALGVTEARVRQRLQKRTLYGIETRHGWRVPGFQFTSEGELHGWAAVAPKLPARLSPVEVLNWMTLPNEELCDAEDAPISPLDWLRAGRSAKAVATAAADLA